MFLIVTDAQKKIPIGGSTVLPATYVYLCENVTSVFILLENTLLNQHVDGWNRWDPWFRYMMNVPSIF